MFKCVYVVSVSQQMKDMEKLGVLKGALNAEQQLALISVCTDLKTAVEGATFIQVSKDLQIPSKWFGKMIKSCAAR